MKRSRKYRSANWFCFNLLLFLLGLSANGCDLGGGTNNPGPGFITGTIVTAVDSTPVHPSTLVLMDERFSSVVSGPSENEADGSYAISGVAPGRYYLLVFAGEYYVYDRTFAVLEVEPFDTLYDFVRMGSVSFWEGDYFIRGTVRDKATGEPIPGAFVSGLVYSLEYHGQGYHTPWETVTDNDGSYVVQASTVISEQGEIFGLQPIAVSKKGYDPAISPVLALPAEEDSIASFDFLLEQKPHLGKITGRISCRGEALDEILVGLNFYDESGFGKDRGSGKAAVPVLGRTTRTDRLGNFSFEGLPAGFYTVEPAYPPDDGYLYSRDAGIQTSLVDGDSVDIGTVEMLLAGRPISPPHRAHLEEIPTRCEWTPHPDADRYRLWITTGDTFAVTSIETTEPEYEFPSPIEDWEHPRFIVRWLVDAYLGTTLVGTFESHATFTVESCE